MSPEDSSPKDLATRLVVATEEQDVLYVLYWLEKMKESNCLEQAINEKHSWKGYSALESIVQSPFTQLRRVSLEVLLLHGADGESKHILDMAMEKRNTEVLEVLLNWKSRGREDAVDAKHLIEMSLEEAANWIDLNLAPPPNAESLTGIDEPPPRPSHLPPPPNESRSPPFSAPSASKLPDCPPKPSLFPLKQPPTAPAPMRSSSTWKQVPSRSPLSGQPSPPQKALVEEHHSASYLVSHSPIRPVSPDRSRRIYSPTTRLNLAFLPLDPNEATSRICFKV